ITVRPCQGSEIFDIWLTLTHGEDSVTLRIARYHTNIVYVEKNGKVLYKAGEGESKIENLTDRNLLNVKDILEFAETADIEDLRPMIQRQIDTNMAIAREGMKSGYGANVGKVLMKYDGEKTSCKARAMAAA